MKEKTRYFKHNIDGSVQEIWCPMYLNYDEAKLHNEKLTKKNWLGFLNWFWGNGKNNIVEPMGWIYQTESGHPTYFDNIELFHEMFKQYKEDESFYNKEKK